MINRELASGGLEGWRRGTPAAQRRDEPTGADLAADNFSLDHACKKCCRRLWMAMARAMTVMHLGPRRTSIRLPPEKSPRPSPCRQTRCINLHLLHPVSHVVVRMRPLLIFPSFFRLLASWGDGRHGRKVKLGSLACVRVLFRAHEI